MSDDKLGGIANDNDLIGNPDASAWAQRFATKFYAVSRSQPNAHVNYRQEETVGLMLAWFSGAIETGRMAQPPTLQEMMDEVYIWCVEKGWEPAEKRTFGDECMLIVTEVAEAMEAYRDHGFDDFTVHATTGKDTDGADLVQVFPPPKPEGVGSEFADVLIRLLHYCAVHEIDLVAEYRRKMDFNKTRSYRHGGKRL